MIRLMLSAVQSIMTAQLNVIVRLCHPVKISLKMLYYKQTVLGSKSMF